MLLRINFLSESFSQNILKSNVGLCQACPFLFMALLFSVSLSVIHHPVVQLDLLAVVVDAHDAVNARGHGHHESSRRLVHLLSGLGRHGAVQDTVRPSLSATAMFRKAFLSADAYREGCTSSLVCTNGAYLTKF